MLQMKVLQSVLIFFAILPLLATGQNNDIETDRPGRSTGSAVTPKRSFQFETGLHRQYDKVEGTRQQEYLYPTLLAKYGLSKKLEVRVTIENERDYEFTPQKHQTAKGLTPVRLGFKYKLWDDKKGLPATSILARAALPRLASADFKGDHIAPAFVLLMDSKLPANISITYNASVEWEANDSHAHYLYTFTPQMEPFHTHESASELPTEQSGSRVLQSQRAPAVESAQRAAK